MCKRISYYDKIGPFPEGKSPVGALSTGPRWLSQFPTSHSQPCFLLPYDRTVWKSVQKDVAISTPDKETPTNLRLKLLQ